MESIIDNNEIPQWKKDLIARLRNQNKSVVTSSVDTQQLGTQQNQVSSVSSSVRQPSGASAVSCGSVSSGVSCRSGDNEPSSPLKIFRMVQERVWIDNKAEMVSENICNNGYHKDSDSDSSEDLHYGPGIVKKLKNKYLSLALRESNNRPSILHLRKATSLENLLDDDGPIKEPAENRRFESRHNGSGKPHLNRYHNKKQIRGEMKRARSVEAISRFDDTTPVVTNNRQSLHEDMLITAQEGNELILNKKPQDKLETNALNFSHRINRPKRIQPIMNEKEKPPVDFVKQAKMIFEKRPEQRTKKPPLTGEVAAKVDSFNNIIVKAKVEAKVAKKPPIKHTKPVLNDAKIKTNKPVAKPVVAREEIITTVSQKNLELKKDFKEAASLPSPIPDVSRVDFPNKGENDHNNLSETPDLILTSSPLSTNSSPKKITDNFLREEKRSSSPVKRITNPLSPTSVKPASPILSPVILKPPSPTALKSASPVPLSPTRKKPVSPLVSPNYSGPLDPETDKACPVLSPKTDDTDTPAFKQISTTSLNNISQQFHSAVFNFVDKTVNQSHLPVNDNVSNARIPPSEPLEIDVNVNGYLEQKGNGPLLQKSQKERPRSPPRFSPPPPPKLEPVNSEHKPLTSLEIEKNLINASKSPSVSVNVSVEVVNPVVNTDVVSKRFKPRDESSNTAVFNFTGRKDVPDYIANDKSRTAGRPELPKPGEGGIIVLSPGLEAFVDEDEEILRSLEGPPSPCDVTFVNDNVVIDGKSSLNHRAKRAKLKISFVEAGPDVYVYPSETSLLLDEDSPVVSPAHIGHSVPNLGGSYLANYMPKTTEDFLPGVTRSVQQNIPTSQADVVNTNSDLLLEEVDKPFSLGTNADILF